MKHMTCLSLVVLCLASSLLWPQEKCDRDLEKALGKDPSKQLAALDKALKKCPEHVPTLVALAGHLAERQQEAGDDWLARATDLYEKVIQLDASNAQARWAAASLWEYAGDYARAIPHYQWTVDAPDGGGVDASRRSEAKTHLVTCRFLLGSGKPSVETAAPAPPDLTDDGIKKGAGWSVLKEIAVSMAVGAALGLTDDGRYIQSALGVLTDWENAPREAKVQARNRLLAGMVGTLTALALERNLGTKIAADVQQRSGVTLGDWPEKGYAGPMEDEFRSRQPEEGRKFEISPSFEVVEKWDVPNLAGEWRVSYLNQKSGRINSSIWHVEQAGNRLQVIDSGMPPGWQYSIVCFVKGWAIQCETNGVYLNHPTTDIVKKDIHTLRLSPDGLFATGEVTATTTWPGFSKAEVVTVRMQRNGC